MLDAFDPLRAILRGLRYLGQRASNTGSREVELLALRFEPITQVQRRFTIFAIVVGDSFDQLGDRLRLACFAIDFVKATGARGSPQVGLTEIAVELLQFFDRVTLHARAQTLLHHWH